jgi:hypothetical protein
MACMIDLPPHIAEEMTNLRRVFVVLRLEQGATEDEIYRKGIDVAIEAARLEGCDESDVEVIASHARRDIAETIAEYRREYGQP